MFIPPCYSSAINKFVIDPKRLQVSIIKSPLTPLFQRGAIEMFPFGKGGLRGIF
jgi:hypothetical protein